MRTFLLAWLSVAIVMLPIDFIWLKSMRWFYAQELGDMLLEQPRTWIALIFYIMLAAAIAFFAVLPNLGQTSWLVVAGYGAFLGFAAYGTYDATNHATLKNFSARVMVVDWLWGTTLCAVSATAGWRILMALRAG